MTNQTGNDAFLQLITANQRIIFKICNSYCHNKSDRDDLAQDIIYQLWKSYQQFDDSYKFSTWMYRVALNTAISFYRKGVRTERPLGQESMIDLEDSGQPPDETEQHIIQLQQFINELPELDRALMLLYLEEKTYSEIAEILGISETNVATKISRAKQRLKVRFAGVRE
ncbi:sigma-70 family RNA polymerase sigma factor [uncultured Chitinophaga sp.]|uniref:RNA polymerase sigma factor n=1 Tax=uncultured Chitinophaga sp. TaxID=339340 RepID=UPI0025E02335|nr:sigma-70 family RNA polymerase sigma factor [uncultured Chitinophaga sp.]